MKHRLGIVLFSSLLTSAGCGGPAPSSTKSGPEPADAGPSEVGPDSASVHPLGAPKRLAEGKTWYIAVDGDNVVFSGKTDTKNYVRWLTKGSGDGADVASLSNAEGFGGIGVADHLFHVYTTECCVVPNVVIFDPSSRATKTSGGTSGGDSIDWARLDTRGSDGRPIMFAQASNMAFFGPPDNEALSRTAVDFDTSVVAASGVFSHAAASNSRSFFFVTSAWSSKTHAFQRFDRSSIDLSRSAQRRFKKAEVIGKHETAKTMDEQVLNVRLVANETTLFVFGDYGIESIDLASGKATTLSEDPLDVASAFLVDEHVFVATRGADGGAISRFDEVARRLVEVARLPTKPNELVADGEGFYWTSDSGVWMISR